MNVEEMKDAVKRLYAEENIRRGVETIEAVSSPDLVAHGLFPGAPPGIAGVKAGLGMLLEAFPDARFSIEHLVGEDNVVAARVRLNATHRGPMMGAPPTGKRVDIVEHIFFRFAGGKIVESWGVREDVALMRQIGMMP